MSKKIAYIHGSPRKNGNTAAISTIVIQEAVKKNAAVTEIYATQLKFQVPGCLSCMKCHQSNDFACVIGDQLAAILTTLPNYDTIVLATPTYWMSYPAQVKMLVDRMGSLMKFTESGEIRTPLAGKAFALLTTGTGALKNNLDLLEQQWRNVAYMLSCNFTSCLFPNAPKKIGALIDDPLTLGKAQEFGRQLAS